MILEKLKQTIKNRLFVKTTHNDVRELYSDKNNCDVYYDFIYILLNLKI